MPASTTGLIQYDIDRIKLPCLLKIRLHRMLYATTQRFFIFGYKVVGVSKLSAVYQIVIFKKKSYKIFYSNFNAS